MRAQVLGAGGMLALVAALAAPASASYTFNVQVNASTQATISVTTSGGTNVVCDPGTAVTGLVACTNTIVATGNIRTHSGGTGAITVAAPSSTVAGTSGNSLPIASLKMTCADNGSTGTHGSPTFAASAASATSAVSCASWTGPDVFNYDVQVTYAIEASTVNADSYTLSSGWMVTASAT